MTGTSGEELNRMVLDRMQVLSEELEECGYGSSDAALYLMRILICCFADALGVFEGRSFYERLQNTEEGGLGHRLALLFGALSGNASKETVKAAGTLPEISRELFSEALPEHPLSERFGSTLLSCEEIPFETISPAIFGALFQNITDRKERRSYGAYYTNEENIDRIIDPLFMNGLHREREKLRGNRRGLKKFHEKLAHIHVLDPACGCGNILLRAYLRLRLLEMDVLRELLADGQRVMYVSLCCKISTLQFAGIELDPMEAAITRICMWLTKRKLDLYAAECFGIPDVLPEAITPMGIRVGNALSEDWGTIVAKERLSYIIGNPPYVGARLMNASQKADMKLVFGRLGGIGNLDYVAAWFGKTAEFIDRTDIRAAFVATNSITQGEQASILWKELSYKHNMDIDFAYRTFVWNNITGGAARVHCVIIGFSHAAAAAKSAKILYNGSEKTYCSHINGYLADAGDIFLASRRKPVSDVPDMVFGSMPNDGGNLILSEREQDEMLEQAPELAPLIRPYTGSEDFLKGRFRCCIWAEGAADALLRHPLVAARIDAVRRFRESSRRGSTKLLALHPERFGEIRQPDSGSYLLVPRVSSERRAYIPVGFMDAEVVAGDAVLMVPGADKALFAVISSDVHMVFVRALAGRLKSDLRYSASFIYNNFPFPVLTEEQHAELEGTAEGILSARKAHGDIPLASLYDRKEMPEDLIRAHRSNDEAVKRIYGFSGRTEEEILSGLFRMIKAQNVPVPPAPGQNI